MMNEMIPGVLREMLSPEYWIFRCEDKEVFQREPCNNWFSQSGKLYELSKDKSFEVIIPLPTAAKLYDACGELLDDKRWDEIVTSSTVRALSATPGFAVEVTDLRRWATPTQAFRTPVCRDFDQFQDTTLHTFEPVIVVGESVDQQWFYVYTTTYRGFVQKESIATTSWETFERYQSPMSFAVVTKPHSQTQQNEPTVPSSSLEFAAMLPLAEPVDAMEAVPNHQRRGGIGTTSVLLPVRNRSGELEVHPAIVQNTDVHIGWLSFTRENCIQMAFTLLHERYGWGGRLGLHDCSSFIMDIYRTMGVQLPRDAGCQEQTVPIRVSFPDDLSVTHRREWLSQLHPGDVLFMTGHVMLYLGLIDGRPYVIHDFVGYVEGEKKIPVNQVMVSSLDIHTRTGRSYLQCLTSSGVVMTS